jgi:hypothetical protein
MEARENYLLTVDGEPMTRQQDYQPRGTPEGKTKRAKIPVARYSRRQCSTPKAAVDEIEGAGKINQVSLAIPRLRVKLGAVKSQFGSFPE